MNKGKRLLFVLSSYHGSVPPAYTVLLVNFPILHPSPDTGVLANNWIDIIWVLEGIERNMQ
jgi:hypothetical protein